MGPSSDSRSTSPIQRVEADLERKDVAAMLNTPIEVNLTTGELSGDRIESAARTITDLKGLFRDEPARQALDPNTLVYRVQAFSPVREGEEGGMFWGTTFLAPGLVGDEYFMTKGHHHLQQSRAEFYLTITGTGALILLDEKRRTTFEPMRPHTLHYIPGHTAHRVANTGDSVLAFLAAWPSDAGHDYGTIARVGFSARLRKVGGIPTLVEES